ncbi:MocR-like pyridoxine biosynthesis transcription factor PdxR [Marinobacterium arenosum]|uniref:MocR-like pyridoxine biosynthesis transcription factor PdxR n=1 Tax=Marinobacterium arenosum TaxID=2862496 RepID=UPI0021056CD3|nr:PLP-dependent aminotransferase family protein [Marinobacterium arenosum]
MSDSQLSAELFRPFLADSGQDDSRPRYRRLFRAFQQAILSGLLPAGAKLPASRALSSELSLSRNTVKTVYEMLQAEGYIETRHGAGSFVSTQLPELKPLSEQLAPVRSGARQAQLSRLADRLAPPAGRHRLRRGDLLLPAMPALDQFPWQSWQRSVARAGRAMKFETESGGLGLAALRQQIVDYLGVSRGIRCDAGQVLICSGSQQAIWLALSMLVDPGEPVLVENPGFPGIDGALAAVSADRVPVTVDVDGFRLLDGLQAAPQARLALLTPSRNYPMGYTLSLQRRLELLQWAEASGGWIIEDDYDSEFRFDGSPLTALQGLAADAPVIYAGTFSRILHPAIRLGYLILPRSVVDAFATARAYLDGGLSLLPQLALADFMASGQFSGHVRRMRKLYKQRRDLLTEMVQARFGKRLQRVASDGGMHSVYLLPDGCDDRELYRQALERGVGIRALSHYYHHHVGQPGLVIGFAGYDAPAMAEGLDRLQPLIEQALGN